VGLDDFVTRIAGYEVVVIEGCDGTGKTTLAAALNARFGFTVLHSSRPGRVIDQAAWHRSTLARPGRVALDRSFVSELVYGPLLSGECRLSAADAARLAFLVADRGGVLVHLTGLPETLAARLLRRDGYAPPVEEISARVNAYRNLFPVLADAAPVITEDTTAW
jgi:predicted ATPase